MKLKTYCGHELWSGFFGINANGDQPECDAEIEIDIDGESIERDGESIRPCFSVECPKCHSLLEWPQEWEIVCE